LKAFLQDPKNPSGGEEMKIAISSTGPDLMDLVDPRFSRCSFYVFWDMETSEHRAVENTGARAQ
jgi:predicted Fe-Mo cluster-binding NifX family protein